MKYQAISSAIALHIIEDIMCAKQYHEYQVLLIAELFDEALCTKLTKDAMKDAPHLQSVNYAKKQLTSQIAAMYLGCEAIGKNSRHGERRFILESAGIHHVSDGDRIFYRADEIKLVLRPMSDITEEENAYVQAIVDTMGAVHDAVSMAEITAYLTSKHFDLFGLIEAGLAVEKTSTT